mmetsp:Transcript_7882/g.29037  ORF Transcript_7882/g.29037 Transcript_7882/m.29037 type:complete len:207 (-) Transcript_7882:1844-2464(-)
MLPRGVELVQGRNTFRAIFTGERGKAGYFIRHVIRGGESLVRHGGDFRGVQVRQITNARVLQRTRGAISGLVGVLCRAICRDGSLQVGAKFGGERRHDKLARGVHRGGVDGALFQEFTQFAFTRNHHRARDECLVRIRGFGSRKNLSHGIRNRSGHGERLARLDEVEAQATQKRLTGFPSIERVRIVRHQKDQIVFGQICGELDRG